jgi:hypothetical protein
MGAEGDIIKEVQHNHRTHTSLGSTFTAWSLRFPMGTFVRLPIVSCFCNEFSM